MRFTIIGGTVGGTALAVMAAAMWVTSAPGSLPKTGPAAADRSQPALAAIRRDSEPHAARIVYPTAQPDTDRLFDRRYESDPDVRAIAEATGLSTACVVATLKNRLRQVPFEDGICPERERTAQGPALVVAADHPYVKYSDAELRSLAIADPTAAVVLARRSDSDTDARELYERAVALSWVADPLLEWMTVRDRGGLFYRNGLLDVEAAKKGYEVFLTAAAIDGSADPILATYRAELRNQGVELDDIERTAAEQVAQLRQERLQLTGGERP